MVASNCNRSHRRTRTYNLMTYCGHVHASITMRSYGTGCGSGIVETSYGKLEFQLTQKKHSEIFVLFRLQNHFASEQGEAEDTDLVAFSEIRSEGLRFL